jgi:hypothetical protein
MLAAARFIHRFALVEGWATWKQPSAHPFSPPSRRSTSREVRVTYRAYHIPVDMELRPYAIAVHALDRHFIEVFPGPATHHFSSWAKTGAVRLAAERGASDPGHDADGQRHVARITRCRSGAIRAHLLRLRAPLTIQSSFRRSLEGDRRCSDNTGKWSSTGCKLITRRRHRPVGGSQVAPVTPRRHHRPQRPSVRSSAAKARATIAGAPDPRQ